MKANRLACLAYSSAVVAVGAAAVIFSIYRIFADGVSYQWLVLAYLTVLTGAFTIAIPGLNSKFSVSDTFIFINTILFGTAAGVLTGALDGMVGSFRCQTTSQRRRTVPFNASVLGISVFVAGEVFFRTFGQRPFIMNPSVRVFDLALPVILSVLVYYLCNSLSVAGMQALHSGGKFSEIWRRHLPSTLSFTLAGAVIGALLAFGMRSVTPMTLLSVVPVLVAIYFVNMISLGPENSAADATDVKAPSVAHRPAYRRFHYFMVALGLGFIVLLLNNALQEKLSYHWIVVAALAILSGFVTVKIPGVKIKFSLADTFVFVNTMLFGPVAGGVTAALDGLAGSLRCKSKARRAEFTLFNIAGMTLSAYLAGELFFRILGHGPVFRGQVPGFADSFLATLTLAISYYLINTMAVAVIVALQAREHVFSLWRKNMLWGLTNCIACGLGAVFVAAGILHLTAAIVIAIPVILAAVYIAIRASVDGLPQRATQPAET